MCVNQSFRQGTILDRLVKRLCVKSLQQMYSGARTKWSPYNVDSLGDLVNCPVQRGVLISGVN